VAGIGLWEGGGVRTLLRAVMYAVAVVAGADAYLVGLSLARESGLSAAWAQVMAVLLGAIVAAFVATVPIAIYQRVMRRIVARRRAARVATFTEPEATVVPPPARPRSNQTFGVTARENRALEWPASNRLSTPARQPVPHR
jgi:hypothetical protein